MIDLHIHTSNSDGSDSFYEVLKICKQKGLSTISVTDHDNIDVYCELVDYEQNEIQIVPGVEITSYMPGYLGTIHILGFFIKPDNQLKNILYNNSYENFLTKQVNKLNEEGYLINKDELRNFSKKKYPNKYDIAELLVEKGYFDFSIDALEDILSNNGICYYSRELLTAYEAIKLINRYGGISVLAHPLKYRFDTTELVDLIEQLVNNGLEGLEVYYPSHSKKDCIFLEKLTTKYKIFATGGSDYHGNYRIENKIGSVLTPENQLIRMKKHIEG